VRLVDWLLRRPPQSDTYITPREVHEKEDQRVRDLQARVRRIEAIRNATLRRDG